MTDTPAPDDDTTDAPTEIPDYPWERQPGESAARWRAFVVYRDLGLTRSLQKAAEELGMSRETLKQYSARDSWGMRAAAFDAEQDREARLWMADERQKAIRRHVKQAQALTNTWLSALSGLDASRLTPQEIIRYAEVSTKMEQAALSFEQTLHVTVEDDISLLSQEDTKLRLQQIQREAAERLAEMEAQDDDANGRR